ncbi:MAG: hypothetical protein ACOCPS_06865 [Desulfonatronovibrio sp.]
MQNLFLPFFGLGFDLNKAVQEAGKMYFCRFVQPGEEYSEQFVSPWGIELLTYLNRETRGS